MVCFDRYCFHNALYVELILQFLCNCFILNKYKYYISSLILQFYDHELEEVPDFEGFRDWVHTFHLYRGKKTDDEEDDMNRVVGSFKGTFCIYKINEDDDAEDVTHTHTTLAPKLRLSERLPSPKPFEVLVRIYVLQVCPDMVHFEI